MARPKSPEKRAAILEAATAEIAESGVGVSTARIAKRAGVAEGTLFMYFPTKDVLLNELYLDLKREGYARLNADFPVQANLKTRARHVWLSYLGWAIDFPLRQAVSVRLHTSGLISDEAQETLKADGRLVAKTMSEVDRLSSLQNLPAGFASAAMRGMQEATLAFAVKQPRKREQLLEDAFDTYWRMLG